MKLWKLTCRENKADFPENDPWLWRWDKSIGFIVRAESSYRARNIASKASIPDNEQRHWFDPKYVDCVEITTEGSEAVIMRDFQGG